VSEWLAFSRTIELAIGRLYQAGRRKNPHPVCLTN
jgi:hypothetical protein